jgi:hypothetical protein
LVTTLIELKQISFNTSLAFFLKSATIIVLIVLVVNTLLVIYSRSNIFNYVPIQQAAQWLDEKSDKQERIFLTNWSIFPMIFFENSHDVYTMGMEPMSLKNYDESLYWKYYNIFSYSYYCDELKDCKEKVDGEIEYLKNADEETRQFMEKENGRKIVESIKNDFNSKFILSTSKQLTTTLLLNKNLIEEYTSFMTDKDKNANIEYTVFKLK